jgi:hypothetical protein
METIFASLCAFLVSEKGAIATSVIASGTYDMLKNTLSIVGLKERLTRFFSDDVKAESFVRELCQKQSSNSAKPYRDVEDLYELVAEEPYNEAVYEEIKSWIHENESSINSATQNKFSNQSGFNIGTQNAGKHIFNIQGDYKPNKD